MNARASGNGTMARGNSLVTPHDSSWKDRFEDEVPALRDALGPNALAVHHVGSTAIPDILAKPVIDVLVEVADISVVDRRSDAMVNIAYEPRGEYGIAGRRYFRRGPDHKRPGFHVHAYAASSDDVRRLLAFRDYLLAHRVEAERYSALKQHILADDSVDKARYQSLKAGFVEDTVTAAERWLAERV